MSETKPVVAVDLDDVRRVVLEAYAKWLEGSDHWIMVTVGADGAPYMREETSHCVSREEYFRLNSPSSVTVWTNRGQPGPGLSDEEIEEEMEKLDADDIVPESELVRTLEEAGFVVPGSNYRVLKSDTGSI